MGLSKEQSAKKKKKKVKTSQQLSEILRIPGTLFQPMQLKTKAISILQMDHGYSNTSAINGVSNFSTMLQRTKEASSAH